MAKYSLGRDDARPSIESVSPVYLAARQPSGENSARLGFSEPLFGVYVIAAQADHMDVRLLLEARLAQLEALLLMSYGGGREAFRELNEESQDAFLWACAHTAHEVRALYKAEQAMRAKGGAA